MARIILNNEESVFKENFKNNINSKLGTTSQNKDSVVNVFSSAVGDEIVQLRRELEGFFNSLQMSNVSGEDLNQLAFETYGLNRKIASKAYSEKEDKNVVFYVEGTTFGGINLEKDIFIPKGTRIYSSENIESSIIYELTEGVLLDKNNERQYASVRALNEGYESNISERTLKAHSFTDYSNSFSNKLKVTNMHPIVTGSNEESDENLRYRLVNFVQSNINKNIDYITMQSLTANGVIEGKVIPSYYGIGTNALILFGSGRETSANLKELVESRIEYYTTPGDSLYIVDGINVYVSMKIRIYLNNNLNRNDVENSLNRIKEQAARIIKEKEFSSYIDFKEVQRELENSLFTENIIGYGNKINSSSMFEEIYIRKSENSLLPEERYLLSGDVLRVNEDERVRFENIEIVEESVSI